MARGKREGKMTQREMVSAAMEVKGSDAKPAVLHAYIKETYNTELPPNIISNHKFQLKKGSGPRSGAKPRRKPTPLFADLEAVRGLIKRLGTAQVMELVEVAEKYP